MSETKKRKLHSSELKAKVGLEALRGVKAINEIGQAHGVHPVQVGQWKRDIQEQASTLFDGKRGPKPVSAHSTTDALYSEIGRLKMELDWQKKVRNEPAMTPQQWIVPAASLSLKCQYLVAIIDWYSRQVLSWRISNTMEAAFCVDCLADALRNYGRPEIFNTDQGSRFTSEAFTSTRTCTSMAADCR